MCCHHDGLLWCNNQVQFLQSLSVDEMTSSTLGVDGTVEESNMEGKSYVTKDELVAKLSIMFEDAGFYPTHVVPSLSLG